jgi:Na+(H+)/acetate symporter ActP
MGMVVPCLIALVAGGIDITLLVGWAFAVAASTFCPLLLLGIWWTRLTPRAAVGGMIAGAVTASTAIAGFLIIEPSPTSFIGALLTEPAIISVPVAFGTMVGLSIADRRPRFYNEVLLSLHAPEETAVDFDGRGVGDVYPFGVDFDRSSTP